MFHNGGKLRFGILHSIAPVSTWIHSVHSREEQATGGGGNEEAPERGAYPASESERTRVGEQASRRVEVCRIGSLQAQIGGARGGAVQEAGEAARPVDSERRDHGCAVREDEGWL